MPAESTSNNQPSKNTAQRRLGRLLVMVPWVSAQQGPTVEEVCNRFEMTEAELEKDLQMLFLCGLYPFTPDSLIEADIVDSRVWIRFKEAFVRPPTFTRQEAVAVVAAAAAIAEMPGETNPHLRSGLAKLTTALGLEDPEVVDVSFSPAPQDVLEQLRQATRDHQRIEVDYYSYGRDAWARRQIDPYRVFNQEGRWYVQGKAHQPASPEQGQMPKQSQIKVFRIDRMRDLWVLDQSFTAPSDLPAPSTYTPRPEDPVVVLRLCEQDHWVAEQYPVESRHPQVDGSMEVSLRVSEPAWLERLLLRLRPESKLVSGQVDLAGLTSRMLAKYR